MRSEHDPNLELYAEVKRSLAERTWRHVQHCADAKTKVVQEILARAGGREQVRTR